MTAFTATRRAWTATAVLACATLLVAPGCSREPTTPEARRQRGDEIVRRMSDHIAGATTLTVEAADTRPRIRGGKEVASHTTRTFTMRRPDRLAVRITGDVDLAGWYDGTKLTFVSDRDKVWARTNGAPTIDDTLDRLAERLAMPMPIADFLYSSPFEALIGTASTGGYVGRETVDGVPCVHVAYQHPAVDWDLWVAETGDPLPKKFRLTDKTSGTPTTTEVVFTSWTLGVAVTDATFTPKVPEGYERIPLVVGVSESPEPAPAQAEPAAGAPKP